MKKIVTAVLSMVLIMDKSFIFKNAAPEAVEAYITGKIEGSLKLTKELSGTVEFEKVKSD